MEDVRESRRYPVAILRQSSLFVVTFKDMQWKEVVATLVDLSRTGVGVETAAGIEPGFVWFRDRIGGFKGGVLMWSRAAGARHRAGIRFVPLTASEEQMIREQFDLLRSGKPMSKPEAVIATIMESFTRTCGAARPAGSVSPPAQDTGREPAAEEDIIGQLRTMLSNL